MLNTNIKTVYRRLFLGTVSIAGLYFLYKVKIILVPFILAFFIAYLLNPLVYYIENKKVPRGLAILLVYMVLFCMVTSIMVFGVPYIVEEFNQLGNIIPKLTMEIRGIISDIEGSYSRFKLPQAIKAVIDERIKQGEELLINMLRAGADSLVKLFSYLLGLIIAPVFAFYMLKDAEQIKNSFVLTIPRKYRSDIMAVLRDLDEIISAFFRGHLIISLIVGVLTGVGMYLVGLDFAFIIGLIAGIAELVPYLGPFITAVPAVFLGLLVSKKTAVYAIIIVLIVQQLENAVISPKILGKSLGLHPLVVIFALLAGGEIYGFAGIIMAVPGAAAIKAVLRYIYLKLVDETGSA
ncbi:AI-2E family transporter [Phosphitispora sp. TUW77]|uniref:AI-2E family transporter n=1 Tax=Phosphitispora sp. TUW77 TaxID=3152361 RepID=UPI003AB2BF58